MNEQDLIENALSAAVEAAQLSEVSRAAVNYAIFPGGKRVRPKFLLALARDINRIDHAAAINGAVAVELLHCASLVHDDLPALDNDILRRGEPTVHVRFGAGVATLAGDIIVMLPFQLATGAEKEIANAYKDLCDGQVLDLKRATSVDELIVIHRLKTGALFRLCGELALGRDRYASELDGIRAYCELVGVEFQLLNDLNDATNERGSSGASDSRNERLNPELSAQLPALLSMIKKQRCESEKAVESILSIKLSCTNALLTGLAA